MDRYSRQQLFAPIGEKGQRYIREKHVLLIGAGALGAANAETLVRAGVGKITIVDRDYVEWSNLQRQQLYTEEDAMKRLPKAIAASVHLRAINSDVVVEPIVADADARLIGQIVGRHRPDVIIDSTDNFDVRMIINDVSQKYSVPWIYGACVGSYGLSYVIIPNETPCLRCLLEDVPLGVATCDTAGIISPVVHMVVAHQTAEALKILVGDKRTNRKLVSFDVWHGQYRMIDVHKLKKDDCSSCGKKRIYPALQYENETKFAVLCGRETVQIRPAQRGEREWATLLSFLQKQGIRVEQNEYLLAFTIHPYRFVVFSDGRVFIHGTNDIQEAKRLYYQYLG
ncbi:thiazole biosynthesis adenylyltransferase ThiF [Anoxybacillus flavithermus]|uniref:Dinucleotide-utilizing enzyme involved in molybdopterin and thiamine biosynthesis n=1 Tax=Anoxybacillus flavithermus (strain DSM 21510 / WK1) TaxID=491915 RepID=B7GEW4_ANOFW|nr:thiazole biosynthesis adenylyltransferase ThiF [Anoxybacillus flavithermus]ACJ34669.1 Dinucleotide-utilizing enzyme involved in molybdopterin and thiamine biosynthesis [Anoxybacillus flavithermus WK1]